MAGSTVDQTRDVTGDEYDSLRYTAGSVVGGVVGTVLMTGAFAAVNAVYGPDLSVYETLADLAGVATGNVVGFLLFVGAGAVAWPLLFASLGPYLPGESSVVRGLVFAASLWLGFLAGFAGDYAGIDLLVFVAFSGATHLLYGALLGLFGSKATGGGAPPRPEV
jgi:hypothetical protein